MEMILHGPRRLAKIYVGDDGPPIGGELGQYASYAEYLATLANAVLDPPGRPVFCHESVATDAHLAMVKFAVDFRGRGAAFVFRAVAEGWDRDRLFREVY